MSSREFDFVKVRDEGGAMRSAYRITCGKCDGTADFIQTGHSRKPPIAAEQHFRHRGWSLGAKAGADRCPACWAAITKPRAVKSLADLTLIVNQETPAVVVAEKPEGPTREERRIVFAKLQDVYLDERQGYDAGWTDHRVAEDLGVPRAWVAAIRDENFGPAKDNADIREFLEKLANLESEWAASLRATEEASKVFAKNIAWSQDVAARLKDLERLAKNVRAQVAA